MMWGFGGMGLGWLMMLLFWGLVFAGIVMLVKAFSQRQEGDTALELLKQRYARGEIDRAEFEQKRKDLAR
ncbi:SHOCT domain-containing protein [Chitinimonas sp.]|uniref:SHOCT domain-containing protein n=1 Tax=Chitinimonas sp. TaxID=1934313 RepID=UPI0035B04F61